MRLPHPHPLFRLPPHSIMTRQFYQDPNDHSGHHHTHQAPYPYPYPNLSKQPGQSTQPFQFGKPNPQDTYDDRSRQYGMFPVFETLLGIGLTRDLS